MFLAWHLQDGRREEGSKEEVNSVWSTVYLEFTVSRSREMEAASFILLQLWLPDATVEHCFKSMTHALGLADLNGQSTEFMLALWDKAKLESAAPSNTKLS